MHRRSLADRIVTLILAAGYSSRMEGAFKPLLTIRPHTVVEHTVRMQQAAGISDVRVVVGHRAEEVEAAAGHLGVRFIHNPNYDRGMFSSIQAGVASLPIDVPAFFIMPVDIPFVHPETIRMLLKAFKERSCGIIYPTYDGQDGHPPLISGEFIPEILSFQGEGGLRGILARHDAIAHRIAVSDEMILIDIDTPEDYERLMCRQGKECIPDEMACEDLLAEACAVEKIREHCRAVAALADCLTEQLNAIGAGLNPNLIRAAALLHDICRQRTDHAREGAAYLASCGYERVAGIVARHMDLSPSPRQTPTEAEVVYLADKLILGNERVTLEQRFTAARRRCGEDERALRSVDHRQDQAEAIRAKIEQYIGKPLEGILLAAGEQKESEQRSS